ncbi:MAG: tandem-95 repeat protein, partial [Azospirillum sp.]|nr:tandem-95 repeat protein [Azospirillum sp.]
DGDTLSFALASDGEPAHGTVIVNADGTYSYTPDADYAGTDSFRYTVTDANGASSTATVTLDVTPVADAPSVDVAFGAPSVDPGTSSVTLANFAASAGYHNSFGYYTLNEAGEPVAGRIVWADVKDHVGATLTVPGLDASRTGFFIVPNGDANNPGRIQDGEPVSFVKGADGKWVAVDAQGNAFAGSGGANAIFDAPALNVGGRVLVTDNAGAGNQNWEDIAVGGDRDFNDVNTNAVWTTDANGTSTYPLTVTAAPSDRDGSESLVGVTLTGIPAGATLTDPNGAAIAPNADGSYTLTPAQLGTLTLTTPPGFAGALAVTATATARDGASTANGSDTASVEVLAGNLGPVTSGGVVAGSEDKATSGTLRAQDPDGDPLTFAIAPNGGPTNGTVSIDPNGAYTYTPRANFNGADSFTYTVSDGNGGTATATVVINVASVNDAPTTAGGTASGDEDTVVAGQLAAADIDGGTLSYAIVPTGGPAHGTVSIAANGAYTYTPNPNFNGTDSFTYRVSDGQGGSVTGTVSVTVNAVNDAPTTSGATLAGREDGSISGRVVAADVDGDAPSFVRGQGPANGSLTMNPDGTFEYVPAPNFNGTDTFTYTVSDGKGGTTTGIVSVDVAAVNDAPTTSGGAATAAEDGSVAGRLMGADVDGDALGFSVAPNGAPAHGTLQINPDGSYVYTPNPDFNGTDSFTYLAADGQGGTAIGTISITVTPGNDAPTTSGATLVGAEDGTIAGRVTGADVDGDAFTFALGQGPANGAVTMNPDGTFSYAPSANFNGVDTFTYTVDDGKGGTTTGTVSVNIAAVNDAPTTSGAVAAGEESTVIAGRLTATDVDGDALTFALAPSGGPTHGTVIVNPDGSYSYTPTPGFAGTDAFAYTVGDGNGGTTTASVVVNVAAVDSTINHTVDGTWPGGWAALNVGSPGVSGTGESVSLAGMGRTFGVYDGGAGNNTLVMADGNNALFLDDRYSPPTLNAPRLANIDTIQLGTGNQLVDLTSRQFALDDIVIQGNGGNDTIWSSAGDDLILAGAGTDRVYAGAGDDTVAGGAGNDHLHGASGTDTGVFSGLISDYVFRQDTLGTIVVTDKRAGAPDGTDTLISFEFLKFLDGTISTDGLGVNRPPVAPNVGAAGTEDTATSGQLVATDADGDVLTFALAANGGPANGGVTVNPDGSYTYTPNANFNGTDSFTYTVSDGRGGISTGTVTVAVAAVNDTPTTAGGAASGNEDQTITGALAASDVDGDTLAYALAPNGAPANGTLTLNPNGSYTYTPNANFNGTDSFTYTVSDGRGGIST